MNIRDLRYLVTLAQEKSFVRAAEKSFISQPTLSMQIKKLEEELGVTLFERDKRFLHITAAGKAMVEYATEILQLAQDMKVAAQGFINPFSGQLKLGLFPTLAPYLLPKVIKNIKQALPELILELYEYVTEQCIKKILSGELDAILIANESAEPKLIGIELFIESFYLVCSEQHRLSHYTTIGIDEFPENELILLEEGHCLRDQSLEFCQKSGKDPRPIYSGTSLNTVLSMVSLGEGVTLIPALAVAMIKHLPVKIIPFIENSPTRTIYLYWRKSMQRDGVFIKLAEIIMESVKKISGITLIKK